VADQLAYASDGTTEVVGEETIDCDLVLIAAGFVGPEAERFGLALTDRATISVNDQWQAQSADGPLSPVFAAGDAVRGQSLIVWAIAEGRSVAASVASYLDPDREVDPGPVNPYSVSWVPRA
jgi:glutamate synthase (NADPH/NADH) small chain